MPSRKRKSIKHENFATPKRPTAANPENKSTLPSSSKFDSAQSADSPVSIMTYFRMPQFVTSAMESVGLSTTFFAESAPTESVDPDHHHSTVGFSLGEDAMESIDETRDSSDSKALIHTASTLVDGGAVPLSSSSSAKSTGSKLSKFKKYLNRNTRNREIIALRRVATQVNVDRMERKHIVLHWDPILTLKYFLLECVYIMKMFGKWLYQSWKVVLVPVLAFLSIALFYRTPGPHQKAFVYFEKKLLWCAYWVGLGILSSVGLGTGLHTFLLYLGPHIAAVTMAAYECHSLNFPAPPYPDQIICPYNTGAMSSSGNATSVSNNTQTIANSTGVVAGDELAAGISQAVAISLWAIMSKVRIEAFMWGAGTALGELPPYFMARVARQSGEEPDNEGFQEFEHLLQTQMSEVPTRQSWGEWAKGVMERIVEQGGFLGILICASIPNPLFDLAGITCGYFLVPFWTFFGATLIGKAVVKMHIQKLFVIFAFSEKHADKLINGLRYIPRIQSPFKEYLKQQKTKFHHKPGEQIAQKKHWLGLIFDLMVMVMFVYFFLSIVNSFAQSYHRRSCKEKYKDIQLKAK